MSSLKIDGATIEGMTHIEKVWLPTSQSLHAKQPEGLAWFWKREGKTLTAWKSELLEKGFSLEEIKSAVFSPFPARRPLAPDGFPMFFYQECWDTIKTDLLVLFSEFHSNGKLPRSLNSTFLTLIPKKTGPSQVQDYRPTSLISDGPYKIVAKVLSNLIREVLHETIDESQFAFIENRNIMDCTLLANETHGGLSSSKEKGLGS